MKKILKGFEESVDFLNKQVENADKKLSNNDQFEKRNSENDNGNPLKALLIIVPIILILLGIMAILPESQTSPSNSIDGHMYMSADGRSNYMFENGDVQYIWFKTRTSQYPTTEEGSYTVNGSQVVIDIDGRSDDWIYEYEESSDRLYMLDENGKRFGTYMTRRKD